MTTQRVLTKPRIPDYPTVERLPDPPREPDMEQRTHLTMIDGTVIPHIVDRDDVFFGGEGFLIRNAGDKPELVPDCVFVKGVRNPSRIVRRNGYVISEVGKPPDLVLEVGSRSTGRRDYTTKRELYAEYEVGEYWRFDPSGGEYHDAPLAGDTLVDGKYEPIAIVIESPTRHWGYSEAMELELWWYDGTLRFRDPVSGEFLRTPEEWIRAIGEARAWAEAAQTRAEEARTRAEEWRHEAAESNTRAEAARTRAEEWRHEAAESNTRAEVERAARTSAESRAEAEREARLSAQAQAESEREARTSAESRAEAEREARLSAQAQAEAEREARTSAESRAQEVEARMAEMESELRRLRDDSADDSV